MKIYIATRFNNKQKVRDLHKLLLEKGHEIVKDWTTHKHIKPYEENQELAQQYSIEDMEAVKGSDVFILLTDVTDETGTGMYTEFGAAISLNLKFGKPKIYVLGDYISRSIFYFHPVVNRREKIEQILKEI